MEFRIADTFTDSLTRLTGDEQKAVVPPPLSVGEMTLRLYRTLNYSQNSAHDLRRALNGA